ncbi:MAG: T9SS type A sorting domain-containing protein [Bacteroidetes bacterium]|nr:T9SS type A sorting domain-containing protein [Bacteroidota bacterium]MBL6943298.1 T9SS type A sorting domain-containing protein [Bacteroidales bacterium]
MKHFLLSISILLISTFSFSQINNDLNIEYKCSHSAHQINKNLSFDIYNWQSEYLEDYDVTFYFLDIEVSNTTIYINGNTTINGVALVNLDTFAIELIPEQTITQLLFNGVEYTTYQRDGNNVIVPVNEISAGSSFTAQIFYNGQPPTGGFFAGVTTATSGAWGKDVTWSLSEPFAASDWFAVKQDLEDKADSVWVFLTTDSTNMAGSQGLLTNMVDVGNGKTRYEWKSNYPIDYYLISFAVAEYQEYNIYAHPEEMNGDSILIQNFIYDSPGCLEYYQSDIDETAPMIELFSDLFILYPFWQEKYGHCLTQLGGGMEHQTMTTIGGFPFWLVAHELGHMWFGDNVTCATWSDIWINEGFATYSNYLAEEFLHGWSSAVSFIVNKQNSAMSSPGGSIYIPENQIYPGNEWRIFDSRLSYNKGAVIIHMLRHEIQDDELFFDIMETFQTDYTDSTATGEDFKNTAEDVTGMDFDQFFDQWYYGEGYPIFDIEYYYLNGTNYFTSLQTTSSSTPFFEMLMDFRLYFEDGSDTLISFYQSDNLVEFSVETGKEVMNINVDPNNWTMEHSEFSVSVEKTQTPVTFKLGQNQLTDVITLYFSNTKYGNKEVVITDISGKIVYTGQTSNSKLNINTSFLKHGIYVIRASDDGHSFVKRFIN